VPKPPRSDDAVPTTSSELPDVVGSSPSASGGDAHGGDIHVTAVHGSDIRGDIQRGDDEHVDGFDDRPISEIVDLTPPGDVAREALNRARAAAKAKGLFPGAQRRRILSEPPRSGPGRDGRDPKLFAETLAALLQQRGWVQEVSVGGVIGRWREVVGDDIADHCTPETFENNVLVVRASSTAWATQIRLLVPQLLGVMEREVGQDVVQTITVLGPTGPGFGKGFRSVPGRGVRDTYG
jgi:predicted nucleic acid-binding Zn ribbon protein